ncbi:hypothetical protein GCM10020255_050180 [Rhodococcus baikonurensis]
MTVQTRWASLSVTDYLPHDVPQGRTDLTRIISGQADAIVSFAPRPEFGQGQVTLEVVDEGIRVLGTNEPYVLRSPACCGTSPPTEISRPPTPSSNRPRVTSYSNCVAEQKKSDPRKFQRSNVEGLLKPTGPIGPRRSNSRS